MRTFFAVLAMTLISLLAPAAHAQDDDEWLKGPAGPFGVGVQLGSPTGITAKMRIDATSSLQAAVGFGYFGSLHINVDYVYEGKPLLDEEGWALGWFVGGGGRALFHGDNGRGNGDDDVDIGGRVPFGLTLKSKEV